LALVVNELVQNSIEHGFAGRGEGCIEIDLADEPDRWIITVRDDGIGLPEDSDRDLGLQIVETLVAEDLRGELVLTTAGGTIVTINIPRQ
jgi:two-component sensor histidine kinase